MRRGPSATAVSLVRRGEPPLGGQLQLHTERPALGARRAEREARRRRPPTPALSSCTMRAGMEAPANNTVRLWGLAIAEWPSKLPTHMIVDLSHVRGNGLK